MTVLMRLSEWSGVPYNHWRTIMDGQTRSTPRPEEAETY